MDPALTLKFSEIGPDDLPSVGGKGANLATLAREGVTVPPGFCVTTRAFELFLAPLPDAEGEAWQQLWNEVETLVRRTAEPKK